MYTPPQRSRAFCATLAQYVARFYKVETRLESKHTAEERLATGIEMLNKKETEFTHKLVTIERETRILVTAKRMNEAKQKLLERNAVRKRLAMTRSVLNNLQLFKNQMDDANVFNYGIGAMTDMAKQFNFSSANMDGLYKKLTSAQESLTEYVDHSEEMRSALTDGYDRLTIQNDDDIEAELQRFLDEGETPAPRADVAVRMPEAPLAAKPASERTPPAHQSFLESVRAKHVAVPVAAQM